MIRALIFDFNGVIADDDPIHKQAFRRVAEEEQMPFSDDEYEEHYLHLNDRDCFTELHRKYHRDLDIERTHALIRRKSVYYYEAIGGRSVLFPGAVEAIDAAAARCMLAVASGARDDEIRHILGQANLENRFRCIVAAEHVENGKPHPEPFLKAYSQLKESAGDLSISECVAIEDSLGGIRSAHAAGMRCLAVAHSYGRDRLVEAAPEWIMDSIQDLPAWIVREVST